MNKLILLLFVASFTIYAQAQTLPDVRTVHESKKVQEWTEPQDTKGLIYMGQVPITWESNSIVKPKMTCVMIGGNILYLKKNGKYDAYSSYKIDIELLQTLLKEKEKFLVLEKQTIEKGPNAYSNIPQNKYATFSNPRQQEEWVLIDGKVPGESIKTFLVTRATKYQWVLKTYENEHIVNYIIQVN